MTLWEVGHEEGDSRKIARVDESWIYLDDPMFIPDGLEDVALLIVHADPQCPLHVSTVRALTRNGFVLHEARDKVRTRRSAP